MKVFGSISHSQPRKQRGDSTEEEGSMSHHDHLDEQAQGQGYFLTSRVGIALLGFITIAGVLLITEHTAHVLGASLWILLLACPLLHIFMHGGHGSHGDKGRSPGPDRQPDTHQH